MKNHLTAVATIAMAALAAICITEVGRTLVARAMAGSVAPTRIVRVLVKGPVGAGSVDVVRQVPALPAGAQNAVDRGLDYLASAQQVDGGFGAGSHSAQHVLDARAVQTDPATTAFAAQAFIRAGSTLDAGPYSQHLRRSIDYLLKAVETSPENDASITPLRGTQPQSKLGQDVDVAFTAQVLGRVLPMADNALRVRVRAALDKCARKLARMQGDDGSWNSRGSWAGTLQSAMALNALEAAQAAGLAGYDAAVARARARQQQDIDPQTGAVSAGSAAGVDLYAITSAQRAAAPEARAAQEAVDEARKSGRLDADATVSAEALESLGYAREEAEQLTGAYRRNLAAMDMLQSDQVLKGFGSNGGEEFLSYMMTSESLFLTDPEAYNAWLQKMSGRLSAIQNGNGSWSGHHCITSPVFCTAAVIMALTTGSDATLVAQVAG